MYSSVLCIVKNVFLTHISIAGIREETVKAVGKQPGEPWDLPEWLRVNARHCLYVHYHVCLQMYRPFSRGEARGLLYAHQSYQKVVLWLLQQSVHASSLCN